MRLQRPFVTVCLKRGCTYGHFSCGCDLTPVHNPEACVNDRLLLRAWEPVPMKLQGTEVTLRSDTFIISRVESFKSVYLKKKIIFLLLSNNIHIKYRTKKA